jgi:hypothetical protein
MDFELRFTDKEITDWGCMALMKRMLDHMGFGAALVSAGLPPPGSNLLKTVVVKKDVTEPTQHALQTLHYKLFARPAYTTTLGRKPILNLAMAMQERQLMLGLWDQAKQFDLPVKLAVNHPL